MASSARIDELRKKFDDNPRRYFAPLANEYRKAGDIEQAIAICREHLPQQPGHMSGHIVFGQALFESSQFEEARSVFETALSLDPENLIALRHLGDIALELGTLDAARGWYERVLEADPRNEEIQSQLRLVAERGGAPAPASVPEVEVPATPAESVHEEPPSAAAELLDLELTSLTEDGGDHTADHGALAGFEATSHDGPADQEQAPSLLDASDVPPPPPPLSVSGLDEAIELDPMTSTAETVVIEAVRPAPAPLDLEEVELEMEPASPEPTAMEEPFVTETMADLLVQQGHTAQAIEVYRKLLAQRPGDATLMARLGELEAPAVSESVIEAGPTIGEFLAGIVAWRPTEGSQPAYQAEVEALAAVPEAPVVPEVPIPELPSPEVSSVSGSIDALFTGRASVADETAALALSQAFAAEPSLAEDAPATDERKGSDARRATNELSLDHVFRDGQPAPAASSFSFDKFFAGEAAPSADAGTAADAAASEGTNPDDIAQFNSWLEGLKKR